MAKLSVIEARKAKAMEQHAVGLDEVNRKLELIMANLGIVETVVMVPVEPEAVVPETVIEPEAPTAEDKPARKKK